MDERSEYEEIIKENLDYDILCQDPKFDKNRFREIMDIMLDAVSMARICRSKWLSPAFSS